MSMASGMGWPSYNNRRSDEGCCDWWYDKEGIMGDCRGCFNETHDCLCAPESRIPCGPILCVVGCLAFSPLTWICACTDAGAGKPRRRIYRDPPPQQAMRVQRVAQTVLPPLQPALLPVHPQIAQALIGAEAHNRQVIQALFAGEANLPLAQGYVAPNQQGGAPEAPVIAVAELDNQQAPIEGAGLEEGAVPEGGSRSSDFPINEERGV